MNSPFDDSCPAPAVDLPERRVAYAPGSKKMRQSRTLLFCTTYCDNLEMWENRVARWLKGIEIAGFQNVTIAMIDDGSPTLPRWPNIPVVRLLEDLPTDTQCFIFHFNARLGRHDMLDMPGWYRSFAFSRQLAKHFGCARILHIESDAFVLSERLVDYLETAKGWTALWPHSKGVPESGIEVIAPDAMELFEKTVSEPYETYRGKFPELAFPFTHVEKRFVGDRYGETRLSVPWEADWTMQAHECAYTRLRDGYFWFLESGRKGDLNYRPDIRARWIEQGKSFVTVTGGVGFRASYAGVNCWFASATSAGVTEPLLLPEACARACMYRALVGGDRNHEHGDASAPKAGEIRIPSIRMWDSDSKFRVEGDTFAIAEIDRKDRWHIRYSGSRGINYRRLK